MAGRPTAKIRFVRCPKCFHVLREPPDVPVYACGGCGTCLQAKVRQSDAGNAAPNSGETNAAQTNNLVHLSDDEVHGSQTLNSLGECSLDQSGVNDLITSGSCNDDCEQQSSLNSPNGDQKNGFPYCKSGDSDGDQLAGLLTTCKNFNNGKESSKSGENSDEQIGGMNLSNEDLKSDIDGNESIEHNVVQPGMCSEVCSANGLGHAENEELSPLTRENAELELNDDSSVTATVDANNESKSDSKRSGFNKLDETNGNTLLVTARQPTGEKISSNFLASSPHEELEQSHEGVPQDSESLVDTSETIDFVYPSSELSATLMDLSKSPTARENAELELNDDSSVSATVDADNESKSDSKRSGYRKPDETNGNTLVVTARQQAGENISSNFVTASPNEELEQRHEGVPQDVKSLVDTKETIDFINPSSKLSGALTDLSKSPTTRENVELELNDDSSVSATLDADNESKSDSTRSGFRKLDETNENTLLVITRQPAGESISSNFLTSPHEELEHLHEGVPRDVEFLVDTKETSDFVNPSSELSCALTDLSKSPTTRENAELELNDDNSVSVTVDVDNERKSDSKRSGYRKLDETNGNTLVVTACQQAGENISSNFVTSSPNEKLEQRHEGVPQDVESLVDTKETIDFINANSKHSGALTDLSKSATTRENAELELNDESSVSATVDADNESKSDSKRSGFRKLDATNGNTLLVITRQPAGESISSNFLTSPHEELEHPHEGVPRDVESLVDTMETIDFVIPSSELSGAPTDLSKSTTTRENTELELNDDSSVSAAVDADNESKSDSSRSGFRKLDETNGNTLLVITHQPAGESISSNFLTSPHEELEHPREGVPRDVESLVDTSKTIDFVNPSSKLSGTLIDLSKSPSTRENAELELNDGSFVSATVDADNESKSDSKRSSFKKLDETNKNTSLVTARQQAGENISSNFLTSSPNEVLEQPHEGVPQDVESLVDTSETIDFVNPSSELSGTLIDLSKSPTTRSSRAYYGDGISSNDGTDDQLPEQQRHPSRCSHKLATHVASSERPRREKFEVNSDSKMQPCLWDQPTVFFEKSNDAIKSSRLNHDEPFNPMTLGLPTLWRRIEDGDPSRGPLYRRGSSSGYESHPYQLYDEYHLKSSFISHDDLAYHDEEKTKLLRLVYELQDQLNNSCCMNEIANEKVSAAVNRKNHHTAMYDSRESLGGQKFIYPQHLGRFREGRKWYQQSERSSLPFCANVRNGRQQVDHSWCCCSEDPAQTPSHTLLHGRGFCWIHSGVNYYGAYGSRPSSLPLYIHGTKSDDQGQQHHEVKKCKREKRPLIKQHLRPMAGAAPFVTCSFCLRLLQLPADFLLFGRRCLRLRCGACSVVLKFSLLDQTHLVPYAPASEVNEYADSVNKRDLASSSYVDDLPGMSSVSSPDDRGNYKSCLAGGTGRKVLYSSPERRKKSDLNASRNKFKYLAEMHEFAGPSSSILKSNEVLSENKELPAGGGSPLHLLMGYSSPSHVIYGWGDASQEPAPITQRKNRV